eukprot:6204211-Pleurochrysis_carterae.AAC.7
MIGKISASTSRSAVTVRSALEYNADRLPGELVSVVKQRAPAAHPASQRAIVRNHVQMPNDESVFHSASIPRVDPALERAVDVVRVADLGSFDPDARHELLGRVLARKVRLKDVQRGGGDGDVPVALRREVGAAVGAQHAYRVARDERLGVGAHVRRWLAQARHQPVDQSLARAYRNGLDQVHHAAQKRQQTPKKRLATTSLRETRHPAGGSQRKKLQTEGLQARKNHALS